MPQVLWVSHCGLTGLDGLNALPSLKELYAAFNQIENLEPIAGKHKSQWPQQVIDRCYVKTQTQRFLLVPMYILVHCHSQGNYNAMQCKAAKAAL